MIVYNNIESGLTEVYLGDNSITEVYIGDEKVFPSGGTYGNKFYGEYLNGETLTLECEGETSNLTLAELTSEGNPSLSALTNATFGGCLKNIADYGNCTFSGATNLSSVTISEGTITLHKNTFGRCGNLKTVTLPETLQIITQEAFYFCTSLSSVTLGGNVTSIGNRAFAYCSSLTSITIKATTPPYLGMGAFNGTNCPIYVPAESVEVYKSASSWSGYASRIQAIPSN